MDWMWKVREEKMSGLMPRLLAGTLNREDTKIRNTVRKPRL